MVAKEYFFLSPKVKFNKPQIRDNRSFPKNSLHQRPITSAHWNSNAPQFHTI